MELALAVPNAIQFVNHVNILLQIVYHAHQDIHLKMENAKLVQNYANLALTTQTMQYVMNAMTIHLMMMANA